MTPLRTQPPDRATVDGQPMSAHRWLRRLVDRTEQAFARWAEQQRWRSRAYQFAMGYARAWQAAPMRHLGIMLVTCAAVHAIAAALDQSRGSTLGMVGLWMGLGCLGLRDPRPWPAVRATSRVFQWWQSQRIADCGLRIAEPHPSLRNPKSAIRNR